MHRNSIRSLTLLLVVSSVSAASAQSVHVSGVDGLHSVASGDIVSSSAAVGGPWNGTYLNDRFGATTFYNRGYTGTRTVVANVEGGTAWSGHETLQQATTQIYAPGYEWSHLGEADRHATWTAATIAGRPTHQGYDNVQTGMAPGAELWSGAIATSYQGTPFTTTYNFGSWYSLFYPYKTAMIDGVGGRTADVVSSSWGWTNGQGAPDHLSVGLDAMIAQSHKTFVAAAGNEGYGLDTVRSPATSQNSISVAALGPDTDGYHHAASFSSGGYSDYYGADATIVGARVRVDIAAPGQNMTLAYYGGATGGNYGGVADGGAGYYSFDCAGTSFAAPTVAGAAALLVDAGKALYGTPEAIDGRIVKAVLLNSATKTDGWDNGQRVDFDGVIRTDQALDSHVGAGALNLTQALDQYTGGTHDLAGLKGGQVKAKGWDFGSVDAGTSNDYLLGGLAKGSTFTATLNWFVDSRITELSEQNGFYYQFHSFTDLDLQLLTTTGTLVAESTADYISTEHFSIVVPTTTSYMLRVLWKGERYDVFNDANGAQYGLAWSGVAAVPEPASFAVLGLGLVAVARRRRSSKQA